MKISVLELKWSEFRQKFIKRLNKRRDDELAGLDRSRERSIRILQKRYGYTWEQAKSELRKHYSKARLG